MKYYRVQTDYDMRALVLARDEEEARKLFLREFPYYEKDIHSIKDVTATVETKRVWSYRAKPIGK